MDLLRRHTEEQEINIIPIKTAVAVHRTRIARKNGARQTSFLAHQGSLLFLNQCAVKCHHTSPGETKLHLPVKKMSEAPSTRPRTRRQNCRSQNRPPSRQNRGHRKPNAHRADNERSVDLGLVPSRNKRTKMSPRRLTTCGHVAEDNGV